MTIVRDFKIGLIMLDFISIRLAKCETLAKYCNHDELIPLSRKDESIYTEILPAFKQSMIKYL